MRNLERAAMAGLAGVLLAACSSAPIEQGPLLKELARRDAPDATKLQIESTPPPKPSADDALDNYRRIADLATDPAIRAEANRRLADLQIQLDEAGIADEESDARQRDAIARYKALLVEFPADDSNDRLLYQMARAHQNVGEWQEAAQILQRLTQEYPDSRYAGDAHFRRGELLFRLKSYAEAAQEYQRVMGRGPDTAYFEPAQYKYGWSLFKQGLYEQALGVFLPILERELPVTATIDAAEALQGVAPAKRDLVADALRVASLSFLALGGGEALNRYAAAQGEPRFYPLLFAAVGEQLLERKRFSDAAKTYVAFQERQAGHPLAPDFQHRAIDAYAAGGFTELAVGEKERFVQTYDPKAAYWQGRTPDGEVLARFRGHLSDTGRFYHARGQQGEDRAQAEKDLLLAARHYRRWLDVFPQDAEAGEFSFLLAEALMEGGKLLAAAHEYRRTAQTYPGHARAADAAYAAVVAYQKHADQVAPASQADALRLATAAGLAFAATHPQRPEVSSVLVRAAEDLYRLGDMAKALETALRALARPLDGKLRATALAVQADAHFALQEWANAERAYVQLLALPDAAEADHNRSEQLAAAIYKQGELAREAADWRAAAGHFGRVARLAPQAGIRATADYDAAAALISLKDWPAAIAVLEAFRRQHPQHRLLPEVDKKLAVAYEQGGQPQQAALALQRVAGRSTETADLRREAAWSAAVLLEQAGHADAAAQAFAAYVQDFPRPLEAALDARARLAEFAKARGDQRRQKHWLREIVDAARTAESGGSARIRVLAAQAALTLAVADARAAQRLGLRLPLEQSLPRKKAAVEQAIASLNAAAEYGIAEVTTAATFELGQLYQDLGRALLESERPRGLSALELEQYNLLLEEQAFPFEEKALEWHETNLKRLGQGVYNSWVGRSAEALAQLAPGRYGKREQGEDVYDELR